VLEIPSGELEESEDMERTLVRIQGACLRSGIACGLKIYVGSRMALVYVAFSIDFVATSARDWGGFTVCDDEPFELPQFRTPTLLEEEPIAAPLALVLIHRDAQFSQ
jgi:hypothetical protein